LKSKLIATLLMVMSLMAVPFIATASAGAIWYITDIPILEKTYDKYVVITITTTGDLPAGADVLEETVKLTYYLNRDLSTMQETYIGADNVEVTADTIVIRLTMRDAVPALFQSSVYNIVGDLSNGDSFQATGPHWGWGGFR